MAETNGAGTTVREYLWLGDLPVAVLDGTANPAAPTLLWVHADHLNRPWAMTNAARQVVWRASYEPFGAVHSITGPASLDARFPGQWFQLESGLAYNWHRHYDASTGRYTQPDPLGTPGVAVAGAGEPSGDLGPVGRIRALSRGPGPWLGAGERPDITPANLGTPVRVTARDGASLYGYAGQDPLQKVDPSGLQAEIPTLTEAILEWLGPGAICKPSPKGATQLMSADRTRLIRFDITPGTSHGLKPHINTRGLGKDHIFLR